MLYLNILIIELVVVIKREIHLPFLNILVFLFKIMGVFFSSDFAN